LLGASAYQAKVEAEAIKSSAALLLHLQLEQGAAAGEGLSLQGSRRYQRQ